MLVFIPFLISCGSDSDSESGLIIRISKGRSVSNFRDVDDWGSAPAESFVNANQIDCLAIFALVPGADVNGLCTTVAGSFDIPVTVARGYFPVFPGEQEIFVPIPSGNDVRITVVALNSPFACAGVKNVHKANPFQASSNEPLAIFSEFYDLPPGGVVTINGNILNGNIATPVAALNDCFGPAFGD